VARILLRRNKRDAGSTQKRSPRGEADLGFNVREAQNQHGGGAESENFVP